MINHVFHDPTLSRAAAQAGKPHWWSRMLRMFGREEEAAPAAPEPVGGEPLDPEPGIEALAATLAELIEAAQARVEGAASIVGRSALEAQVYREQLANEVEVLSSGDLPADMAASLIEVTRAMIDRTRSAEGRLRTMGRELKGLQRELDEARCSAERDPLTGLPNRRALEKALDRAVQAARRTEAALSLAFCDIDNFKALNDTHGHALGDRVLRLVGDSLADGAGEEVFVGRQSGEEFIMLFAGLEVDEAARRVDVIRAKLAARVLRSRTNDKPIGNVTFSAGVAMLAHGEQEASLLRRADRALYRAKYNGRNRIEVDRNG